MKKLSLPLPHPPITRHELMAIVKQKCAAHSLWTSHPVTAERFDVSEARTDHRTRGQESWPMSLCQEQFSWLLSACLGFLWLPPVRGSLASWLCAIACIASRDPWKDRLPPDSGWEDAFSSHGQMLITLGWFSGRSSANCDYQWLDCWQKGCSAEPKF